MPRQDPRFTLRRSQLPRGTVAEAAREDGQLQQTDLDGLKEYVVQAIASIDNDRHEFKPKVEVGLTVDQATTTALAAVAWEAEGYDNGGMWDVTVPTQLLAVYAGIYAGTFQTKLSGAGDIRVQLAVNGTLVERGTDVTLSGDFTFAFSWQIYLNENDYVEVHVSTSGSRDLVAEWTKASMHQLDYLEAV